jgi:hypothetical protein
VANQFGCHRPQRGDIESRVQQSYREPSNPRPDHHCFLAPHQPPIRPNGGLPHLGLGIKPDRGSASKWRIYVAMLAAFGLSIDDEAYAWRDLIRDWLRRPAHAGRRPVRVRQSSAPYRPPEQADQPRHRRLPVLGTAQHLRSVKRPGQAALV